MTTDDVLQASDDVPQASKTEQVLIGPGKQLKEARQSKGFTVASLADRLKVPESYISGLESDDYSPIPELVFARGYVRSFARAVGLDGDEMVSCFDRFTGSDSHNVPHLKPGTVISYRRHMSPVVAWSVTLAVIIVVGAVSYFAWNQTTKTDSAAMQSEIQSEMQPELTGSALIGEGTDGGDLSGMPADLEVTEPRGAGFVAPDSEVEPGDEADELNSMMESTLALKP